MQALSDVLDASGMANNHIKHSLKFAVPGNMSVWVDTEVIEEKRMYFSLNGSKPQRIKLPALVKKLASPKYNEVGHERFKGFLEWSPDTWGRVVDDVFGSLLIPDLRVLTGWDLAMCYEPSTFHPTLRGSLTSSCMSRVGKSENFRLCADNPEIFQMWTVWVQGKMTARRLGIVTTTGLVMVSDYGHSLYLSSINKVLEEVGATDYYSHGGMQCPKGCLVTEPLRYDPDLQKHPNLNFMARLHQKNLTLHSNEFGPPGSPRDYWILQTIEGGKIACT